MDSTFVHLENNWFSHALSEWWQTFAISAAGNGSALDLGMDLDEPGMKLSRMSQPLMCANHSTEVAAGMMMTSWEAKRFSLQHQSVCLVASFFLMLRLDTPAVDAPVVQDASDFGDDFFNEFDTSTPWFPWRSDTKNIQKLPTVKFWSTFILSASFSQSCCIRLGVIS